MKIPSPTFRRRARIEIIPLIDIIFFLLATFVMVSLSMVKNQGISVRLPKAESSQPVDRQESATISVAKDGQLYFNKEPLARPQLLQRVQSHHQSHPEMKLFIQGDEEAFFGMAISVLDDIRKLGITQIAIQTRPTGGKNDARRMGDEGK